MSNQGDALILLERAFELALSSRIKSAIKILEAIAEIDAGKAEAIMRKAFPKKQVLELRPKRPVSDLKIVRVRQPLPKRKVKTPPDELSIKEAAVLVWSLGLSESLMSDEMGKALDEMGRLGSSFLYGAKKVALILSGQISVDGLTAEIAESIKQQILTRNAGFNFKTGNVVQMLQKMKLPEAK